MKNILRLLAISILFVFPVTGCLAEAGYELVKVAGMGMVRNRDIGEVTPAGIASFVSGHMAGIDADCVFLSCTNWQGIGAIEPLRARFSVPVISSNQATIDAVRDAVAQLTTMK